MRFRRTVIALFAVTTTMFGLVPAQAAQLEFAETAPGEFEGVEMVVTRSWGITDTRDNPDWFMSVLQQVYRFESDVAAAEAFQTIQSEVPITYQPDSASSDELGFELLEELDVADLELDGDRAMSWQATIEGPGVPGTPMLVITLAQQGDYVVGTVGIAGPLGDVSSDDVDQIVLDTTSEVSNATLGRPAGDDEPIEDEGRWSGGIWDKFPEAPYSDWYLTEVRDLLDYSSAVPIFDVEGMDGLAIAVERFWDGEIATSEGNSTVDLYASLMEFESADAASIAFSTIQRDYLAKLPSFTGMVDPSVSQLDLAGAQTDSLAGAHALEGDSGYVVIALVQDGRYVSMVTGTVSSDGSTSVPDDIATSVRDDVADVSNFIVGTPASDTVPVQDEDDETWSGGLWEKLPPADTQLLQPAELSNVQDDMLFASQEREAAIAAQAEAIGATATAEASATAAGATATAEAEAATATAQTQADATALVEEAPDGLIAFVGMNANIWVMSSDGSNPQQLTTEGTSSFVGLTHYRDPAWSHDGTMLAFSGPSPDGNSNGIVVYRDGQLSLLPKTFGCSQPVFSGDNERIFYTCNPNTTDGNPLLGLVTSSSVSGADQQLHLAFSDAGDRSLIGLDVRAADGMILVGTLVGGESPQDAPTVSVELYTAEFEKDSDVDVAGVFGEGAVGPYGARFMWDGQGITGQVCLQDCDGRGAERSLVYFTFEGEMGLYPAIDPSWDRLPSPSFSPDGTQFVRNGYDTEIWLASMDGRVALIGEGRQPVWQPVAVEIDIANVAPSPDEAGPDDGASAPTISAAPTIPPPPTPVLTPTPAPTATPNADAIAATEAAETEDMAETARVELQQVDGLIAYVHHGGDIHVMNPDGSGDQQITTDANRKTTYGQLTWSHDGTMLAAVHGDPAEGEAGAVENVTGIRLIQDGEMTELPNTAGCEHPAFSADNQRVYYTCWQGEAPNAEPDTSPELGYLSSSALDGSDQQNHIAYPDATSTGETVAGPESILVRSSDGAVLVVTENHAIVEIYDADFTLVGGFNAYEAIGPDVQGPYAPAFTPNGETLIAAVCFSGCDSPDPDIQLVSLNPEGSIQASWATRVTLDGPPESLSVSPDGLHLVMSNPSGAPDMPAQIGIVGEGSVRVQVQAGTGVAWQPVAAPFGGPVVFVESPEPAEQQVAESSQSVEQPTEPAGDTRIAYVGEDGNIWTMLPDGSDQQQVTTDAGSAVVAYGGPVWSHDGAMLAFVGVQETDATAGVWLARDGAVTLLAETEGCHHPAFGADSQRVFYSCWAPGEALPDSFAGLPPSNEGFLSSSSLDGADRQTHLVSPGPFVDRDLFSGITVRALDIRPTDGLILMVTEYQRLDDPSGVITAVEQYDAAFSSVMAFDITDSAGPDVAGPDAAGPYHASFTPDGNTIVASMCAGGCDPESGGAYWLLVGVGLDGALLNEWTYGLPNVPDPPAVDVAPDGQRMTMARAGDVIVFDHAGRFEIIAPGTAPRWQPVPANLGDVAEPPEPEASLAPTDDAGSGVILPVETPPTAGEDEPAATGAGWIAYVDTTSREVKLIRPDGSEQVIVSESLPQDGPGIYSNPVWSHDGATLAWNGPTAPNGMLEQFRGIWVLANGELMRLPGTEGCSIPAFNADNTRIYYICPGNAHFQKPAEAIIPQELLDVPGTAIYVPTNAYLGSINSSAIDGSDPRIELAYSGDGDPSWGGLSGAMMVYRLEVRPTDGALMLLYRDPVAPPTVAGILMLDANLSLISSTPLAKGDIFPLMLPDGTIVTPRRCENLCPNGLPTTLTALDGTEVNSPVAAQLVGPAWTFDLSPDGTSGAAWSYHDGLWLQGEDGSQMPLDSFGAFPAWQPVPVPVEIAVP